MSPAFTVITDGRTAEFLLDAPCTSSPDGLIQFHRSGHTAAVLQGRLYYQSDLRRRLLQEGPSDRQLLSDGNDAALAAALYEQHGAAGLEDLEGDFTLCVWDAERRLLIGMRDPMGGQPLFWAQSDRTVAVSTSIRSLAELGEHRLSTEFAATFLSAPAPFQELPGEETVFEGIRRVPPGARIEYAGPQRALRQQVYWDWEDRLIDPGTECEEELAAEFGRLLRDAVRERMIGTTASHMSGGMDSTAVSLLAGDCVLEGTRRGPLHTLTLVYERLNDLARERPYIDAVLQRRPDFRCTLIPADDLLDFDSFRDTPAHDEPYAGLWRMALDRSTIQASVRCGAQTMLTGIGADELVDLLPIHVTDLLRRGRIGSAWREISRWAHFYSTSPWNLIHPFGLAHLLPMWASCGWRTWLSGGYADWKDQTELTVAPWICRQFSRRHRLTARIFAARRRYFDSRRPARLSLSLSMIESRCGDVNRWVLGNSAGVAVAHPFLDRRLIAFGLGMQLRHRPQPGMAKPILSKAMGSALPACISQRRCKGDFNEVLYRGLSRNLPVLTALVKQSPLAEMGIVDRGVLLECLQRAALGNPGSAQGWHKLALTLAYMQWLSLNSGWQRRWRSENRRSVLLAAGRHDESRGGSHSQYRPVATASR